MLKQRQPRVGDHYKTVMADYLILAVDRRGLSPRVTMLRFSSVRRTTIRWNNFLRNYGAVFVQTLIKR